MIVNLEDSRDTLSQNVKVPHKRRSRRTQACCLTPASTRLAHPARHWPPLSQQLLRTHAMARSPPPQWQPEAAERLQTLQTDLQEARQQVSLLLSQMRSEDQRLRQETASARDREAADQAQTQRLNQLLKSKDQLLTQALRLQQTTAATVTSTKGTVASTQAELDAVSEQIAQVTNAIKLTEERARAFQDKGAQVSADNAQSEASRDARVKMQSDLADAMNANMQMQAKHALWDSFASLVDIQSKLNAYDDGLPHQ